MDKTLRTTLTVLLTLLALGQFVQVITRYVLEIPLMGLEEAMVYPALWLYMLGAVNASRENTQIRANVLDVFLETDRSKHILAAISDAISLIVGCWLTYWAWDYTEYSLRVWKESPTLYWPMFYADVSLVVGLILVNAFVIYHLIVQCRAIAWRAQSD